MKKKPPQPEVPECGSRFVVSFHLPKSARPGACCVVSFHEDGRTVIIDNGLAPSRARVMRDWCNRASKGTGWRAKVLTYTTTDAIREAFEQASKSTGRKAVAR